MKRTMEAATPHCMITTAIVQDLIDEVIKMETRHVKLIPGITYTNKGGGRYRCLDTYSYIDAAQVENIESGWRCLAHNITMYDDGSIEWDYSTNGYFAGKEN